MTKIYELVRVLNHNGEETRETVEIFTNKKLAKTLAEYWTLSRKKLGIQVHYEVREWEICRLDFSEELQKEQIKELPY